MDYLFNILLVGNQEVGKSTLMGIYTAQKHSEKYQPTIGIDFSIHRINIAHSIVALHIWDTSGNPRFRDISRAYYRGANGFMVVYDVCNRYSFESVDYWIGQIVKESYKQAHIVLIGNCTSRHGTRQVSYEEAVSKAMQHHIVYIETPYEDFYSIKQAFMLVVSDIINELISNPLKSQPLLKKVTAAIANWFHN